MDFKSLIGKLDSIQAPIKTPSAPTLPQAVQLNEDAQLRVLAGRTTYVSEAKKKADEEKKKTDKKERMSESESDIRDALANEIRIILDGALANNDQTDHIVDELGDIFDDIEDSGDRAAMKAYRMMRKAADTDVGTQVAAARRALKLLSVNEGDMVEAATVKYDADGKRTGVVNKDTRKYSDEPHSEPASKAKSQSAADKENDRAADKADAKDSKAYEKTHGKGSVTRVKDGKKVESVEPEFKSRFMKMVEAAKEESKKKCPPMSHIKKMCKDGKSTAEICKMHPDCDQKKLKQMVADCKKTLDEGAKPDFLDLDKDGDKKEPMKSAAGEKGDDKTADKKGLSDKQKKLPPGLQKAIAAKSESKIMPKGKKKTVKESVETKLSFKEMVQLVQESGGQQQIDPVDQALFTWAERVAKNKLGEGMKADLYAGLVYERNGGEFEMYDVLSETQK